MPTLESSSESSAYAEDLGNSLGLQTDCQQRPADQFAQSLPVFLFPPQMLISDDIHDFPMQFIISCASLFGIDQNIPSTLDPDRVSKARKQFDKDGLLIWESTRIEAIAFSFDNSSDRLGFCQGIRWGCCLLGCRKDIALWSTHDWNAKIGVRCRSKGRISVDLSRRLYLFTVKISSQGYLLVCAQRTSSWIFCSSISDRINHGPMAGLTAFDPASLQLPSRLPRTPGHRESFLISKQLAFLNLTKQLLSIM
jgi:hypothetical protein